MDVSQTFDALVSKMKWSEIVSTIEDVLRTETSKLQTEDPTEPQLCLTSAPEVHSIQAASWDGEALYKKTIWSQGVYNQELSRHPGQVTKAVLHLQGFKFHRCNRQPKNLLDIMNTIGLQIEQILIVNMQVRWSWGSVSGL